MKQTAAAFRVPNGAACAATRGWRVKLLLQLRASNKTAGDCPDFAAGTIRRMVAEQGTVGHAAACPMVGSVPLSKAVLLDALMLYQ
jgi:hypothetical protein